MYLLIKTSSSNEHYNGGCDYALVKVTQAFLETTDRRIQGLRDAQEEDDQLYSQEYSYPWEGVSGLENLEESDEVAVDEEIGDNGYALLTDAQGQLLAMSEDRDVDLDKYPRLECCYLRVSGTAWTKHATERRVHFTALLKYADITITSYSLYESDLDKIKNQFKEMESAA